MSPTYCNYVCDPVNNMEASCNKLCPGFFFTTTTQNPGKTQAATTQPQRSEDPDSSALQVVIPCSILVFIMLIVVLVCCCKERLIKLKQSIKHGCLKLSVQETGQSESSISHHVIPGGSAIPGGAIPEVRVQNEVLHPSEESLLLEKTQTHSSADINGHEPSSTNLSSDELRAFIDHHKPEVSIPNPSGLSTGTQHSSGYHSAYNQQGSHEEIVLKTMNLNEHMTSSNTEAKTLF